MSSSTDSVGPLLVPQRVFEEDMYLVGAGARIVETAQTDHNLKSSLHVILIPKNYNPQLLEQVHSFRITAFLYRINAAQALEIPSEPCSFEAQRWTQSGVYNVVGFFFDGPGDRPSMIRTPGDYRFKVIVSKTNAPTVVKQLWSNKFTITPPPTNGVH
ncbi:hypothetical protein BR93DRAFT_976657 [Coniochaeta sp. PMI_546]|nr:hypothetical protein BR93DRAFT_976657 [Coniochaeta sp. PMI_546]